MNNLSEKLTIALGAIFIVIIAAILMAFPTMWLWNGCLIPAVDGFHEIGFWQALGLNVLFSILFKSTSVKSNNG
jgi:hypothetical protein